jgi:hypothetical protein
MEAKFTPQAKKLWEALEPRAKMFALNTAWCPGCEKSTSLAELGGRVNAGELILHGKCSTCGGQIARPVESS